MWYSNKEIILQQYLIHTKTYLTPELDLHTSKLKKKKKKKKKKEKKSEQTERLFRILRKSQKKKKKNQQKTKSCFGKNSETANYMTFDVIGIAALYAVYPKCPLNLKLIFPLTFWRDCLPKFWDIPYLCLQCFAYLWFIGWALHVA